MTALDSVRWTASGSVAPKCHGRVWPVGSGSAPGRWSAGCRRTRSSRAVSAFSPSRRAPRGVITSSPSRACRTPACSSSRSIWRRRRTSRTASWPRDRRRASSSTSSRVAPAYSPPSDRSSSSSSARRSIPSTMALNGPVGSPPSCGGPSCDRSMPAIASARLPCSCDSCRARSGSSRTLRASSAIWRRCSGDMAWSICCMAIARRASTSSSSSRSWGCSGNRCPWRSMKASKSGSSPRARASSMALRSASMAAICCTCSGPIWSTAPARSRR